MQIIKHVQGIRQYVNGLKTAGRTIGFVPTMGALHQGHLSLVKEAKKHNDIVVVSVFVNPIQFNNKEDLDKYPRSFEQDAAMLADEGVDAIFYPSEEEIYPEKVSEKYDFGDLETVMEGAFREGHFNGVAIVVKLLFELVSPDNAYFGEKDFQQLAIVRKLVDQEHIPVKVVACPIIREESGLAMSSRNNRLSNDCRFNEAPKLYEVLQQARNLFRIKSIEEVKIWVQETLSHTHFKLEYFEIVNADTLQSISECNHAHEIRGCIAAYIEGVRLIDNLNFR